MSPPHEYPPAVAELLRIAPPAALGPGNPDPSRRAQVAAAAALLPPTAAAGLWLRFDFLDDAHAICQREEGEPDHDFWHAVMHRREPDAANAKYWWRRVGAHPVLSRLAEQAPAVGYAYTTPAAFVDFCERVRGSGTADEEVARRVQELEWGLQFDRCLARAGR